MLAFLTEVSVLQPGIPAPPFRARPVFGLPIDWSGAAGPDEEKAAQVALCFLGPLSSAPARAALTEIQACFAALDRLAVSVVAISASPLVQARDLVPRRRLLFPLVVEGTEALAEAWALPPPPGARATLGGLDRRRLTWGLSAVREGGGWRGARPPALFLVGGSGRITWVGAGASALDGPDLDGLLAAASR